MKIAISYIRISDDEQSNFSLSGQLRQIQEYCERQGITLSEVFEDDGYSAKNFNRPGWIRLKEHLQTNRGRCYFLIVYK